jgi:prevent-host-death family protein
MAIQVSVQDAKAKLSGLMAQVVAGEEVVIARAGKPMVRLVPVVERRAPRFGFMPGVVSDEALRPLDDDQLALWS